MIFYQEPNSVIHQGHALDILRQWTPECVDCVMTSPPYWGLRTYKTEPQIWGDNHCEHEWGQELVKTQAHHAGETNPRKEGYSKDRGARSDKQGQFCLKCGAWRGELGLEPTIKLYISHLLQIFDEVKRVLKKTGTLWVNLGDSYASGKGTCFNPGGGKGSFSSHGDRKDAGIYPLDRGNISMLRAEGLMPKSLCLIPERFALGMLERGWILRNIIIWYKPNPMPESVKDRFTGAYEYVFFFVKSGTIQYWTNPVTGKITDRQPLGTKGKFGEDWVYHKGDDGRVRKRVSLWQGHTYWFEQQFEPYLEPLNRWGGDNLKRDTSKTAEYKDMMNIGYSSAFRVGRPMRPNELGRNKRDVWKISTRPYPGTHFAVFPEELVEIPILAGCPSMICKKCRKARERIYNVDYIKNRPSAGQDKRSKNEDRLSQARGHGGWRGNNLLAERTETGYTDCGCNAGFEPGVVLDLFAGRGTTGVVAKRLGRRYIGIDISPQYCELHKKCLQEIPLTMELG